MKVRCVDNKNLIEPGFSKLLTIGKEYEILRTETDTKSRIYWIIDDTGIERFYDSKRFTPTIEEIREIKINQILK